MYFDHQLHSNFSVDLREHLKSGPTQPVGDMQIPAAPVPEGKVKEESEDSDSSSSSSSSDSEDSTGLMVKIVLSWIALGFAWF